MWLLATIYWYRQHGSYTHFFIIQCFNSHRFCLLIYSVIGWHIRIHWYFIGISYLAQEAVVLVWSLVTLRWKATSFFLKSAGNFWQREVLLWSLNPFLCIIFMHQPMLALKWCHVMCGLAGSCALYFIVFREISTSVFFFFKHVNSTVSFYNSWKCPCLGPLNDFWVEFAFISFCFCSFHLCTFASTTLNFLAAL